MKFYIRLCYVLTFFFASTQLALSQNAISQRPLTKSEQIDAAIELMVRFKEAVAQLKVASATEAYKRIAIHSFKCSMLYGMLSKSPPSSGPNAVTFANVSGIFNQVSAVIYADTLANYKLAVTGAQQDILNIRKNEEKERMLSTLRTCSELAEGKGAKLRSAISELIAR